MSNEYLKLLKDPRWQKKKTEILTRDNFTCQCCGDKTSNLQVHHLKYIKGHKPWEYEDEELITLCENCHILEHEELNKKMMKEVMIGCVYQFDHSEFTNTCLCYDIDYINKKVFLIGVDNGSDMNTLWCDCFSYKDFLSKCIKSDFFYDNNQEIKCFHELLISLINKLLKNKNDVKINDNPYDTIRLISIIKNNLKNCDTMFCSIYKKMFKSWE